MKSLVIYLKNISCVALVLAISFPLAATLANAQQSNQPQQLDRVEVEPPAQRASSTQGSGQGFGYDQPIPSGQPISDFPLTPSEVVSPTRSTANIATVPSAISVVDNKGVTALGESGIGDMVRGQPGTWASGYAGNSLNSQISIRGFSQTPAVANRVAILLDGRNMEIPRNDANTGFLFPEIIERIELMRGDGTVQFGNKAIGGSLNILLKKPRTNPGTYFGVEGGSWRTQREWAAVNVVKGPIAAGIFLGNYVQEGFRLYEGDGIAKEFIARPGPSELLNVIANVNWKIASRLSFDLTYIYTKQRLTNPNPIDMNQWERRDVRNVHTGRAFSPEERWDAVTIGDLFYDGGRMGTLDLIASYRTYDTSQPNYLFNSFDNNLTGRNANYSRWLDSGISFKYSRRDTYDFIRNDLTLGSDLYDGFYGSEKKAISGAAAPYSLAHQNETHGYRESLSYYLINQTRFWDRLIVTLGYRTENYEFRDLYYKGTSPTIVSSRPSYNKSASLYGFNFVYDKELGSNIYYKHARTYRFPTFTDIVNTSYPSASYAPFPVYPIGPEEGTLEEWSIRHWFTPGIYFAATYYDLDMDNEILGEWYTPTRRWNANVPLVNHNGLEMEGLIKLTPRWTLKGNLTKQKVIYRSYNRSSTEVTRLADKWIPMNPAYMYNSSLIYDNTEWGFSASATFRYAGKRYFQGDDLNVLPDVDEVKIGDIAISQSLFDGSATIYFGINNINDCMSTFNTYYWSSQRQFQIWPDAGRTYYMGLKSNMDFDRMKLPTGSDLNRMQRRLYGAANESYNSFTGMGSWMRNAISF